MSTNPLDPLPRFRPDRRQFLRNLVVGSACATPWLASLSLGEKHAWAQSHHSEPGTTSPESTALATLAGGRPAFTAQIVFTGLGMVVIHANRRYSKNPSAAELLLVRNNRYHHLPKVSFQLSDVADPMSDDVPDVRVDSDGAYLIEERLDGVDTEIQVEGVPAAFEAVRVTHSDAVLPGPGAPEDAIDWLPDVESDFGMSPIHLPEDGLLGSPYIARVRLPAGRLSSRQLFRTRSAEPEVWRFATGRRKALAEQWMWTRSGLTSLTLRLPSRNLLQAGASQELAARTYTLDGVHQLMQGNQLVVRIAITNLPSVARVGRARLPDHFRYLAPISSTATDLSRFEVRRTSAGPVTVGGACPPARFEVMS